MSRKTTQELCRRKSNLNDVLILIFLFAATAGSAVSVTEARLLILPQTHLLPTLPLTLTSFNFTCREVRGENELGRPHREVEWLKDGELIVTNGTRKYRHYGRKGILEVNDISYGDQGVYECQFKPVNGSEGAVGTYTNGRAELWIAPVVDDVRQIQTAATRQVVVLNCRVRGQRYTTSWTRRGAVVASSNQTNPSPRYSLFANGSLMINGSRRNDSNCYTCTASNEAGSSSAEVQLIVTKSGRPNVRSVAASLCTSSETSNRNENASLSSPTCQLARGGVLTITNEGCRVLSDVSQTRCTRFQYMSNSKVMYRPVFLEGQSQCLQTIVGYTVEIECMVAGNPSPRVWWTKDNITISTNTPNVSEADEGEYRCIAENSQGQSSMATTLNVWGAGDICGCVKERSSEGRERRKRITEGAPVESPHHYPWQVLIEYRNRYGDNLCGGTLLRPDWFLTAAHCLHAGRQYYNPSDLIVRVGVVNRSSTIEPSQQTLTVDHILPHPHYNTSFVLLKDKIPEYDIALVKLRHPAILTDAVLPACLPTVNSDPPVGTFCNVSGWGHLQYEQRPSPQILHHTLVPLVNYSSCRHDNAYGNSVTRKHLCAGFDEGGPDACQNDSGGPLVCEKGDRWRLFGVVNHGDGCGHKMKYGLYARVVRYNNWIKCVLAGNNTSCTF